MATVTTVIFVWVVCCLPRLCPRFSTVINMWLAFTVIAFTQYPASDCVFVCCQYVAAVDKLLSEGI